MKIILPPAKQENFHYLKFRNKKRVIKGQFPDFLIIGPQRTGTTWLSANLRRHNEIFFSYPKELYFFNRLDLPDNRYSRHYYAFDNSLALKNPTTFIREAIKVFYFDFLKTGVSQANQLEWYLSFFTDSFLEKAYKHRYFNKNYKLPYDPKVRGEATASYAMLNPEIVKEICALNPNIKIILMIRRPWDRAWSHAKKYLIRSQIGEKREVEDQAFFDFFNLEYQIRCGTYTEQIDNWSRNLKKGNLFIGSYEMIKHNPKQLLLNIFKFLQVDANEKLVGKQATEIINPTSSQAMPASFLNYLQELYSEEVQQLKTRYNIDINQHAFTRILI